MKNFLLTLFAKKKYYFTIIIWLSIATACLLYLPHAGNPFKIGDISEATAESTVAQKLIETKLPYGGGKIIVFYKSNKLSVNHPEFKEFVNKSLSKLKELPFETRITSPYKNSRQISGDKYEAYAVIDTNTKPEELASLMPTIKEKLGNSNKKMTLLVGGQPSYVADVNELSEKNLIKGELISLPISLIAMIFIFGGIIPALITILTGIVGIIIITTILYILGQYMDLTVYVLNIATMLGLGLCLDYTLLITYRFREEWACHKECHATIKMTLATAGKSVFFSGIIVLISIASLMFFPINVLHSMGIAGIVIVAVTMCCSLSFLPAMLCVLEKRVTDTISQLQHLTAENVTNHNWYKLALLVMRRPFMFLFPVILILLMLGYPFLNVKLNNSDAKVLPTWMESRQVMDEFAEHFNANELEPITILFTAKNNSILSKPNIGALYDYAQQLKDDNRVKRVGGIVTIDDKTTRSQYQSLYQKPKDLPFDDYQKQSFKDSTNGKYTVMNVISKYSKDDKRNFELVKSIREDEIDNNITKQVTGFSAKTIDSMKSAYGIFSKVVIFISIFTYLALVWLLRSLILPLKAIIMNLLSLSVCYGMLVFIFQEGHFATLLGFEALGFTDMNLPILIFFILFGISMDYEIFLLTRIREYYEKTGDNRKSVALGLEKSAKIITSAAVILVIVTGAFVTADLIFIKAFGLGAALAIIVDTTLIRLLLVPATMRLLGDWNWYIPKWLDRLLPNINFDQEPSCIKQNKSS